MTSPADDVLKDHDSPEATQTVVMRRISCGVFLLV
jgi:hypothetical protein